VVGETDGVADVLTVGVGVPGTDGLGDAEVGVGVGVGDALVGVLDGVAGVLLAG
jgi:hypothetical protein